MKKLFAKVKIGDILAFIAVASAAALLPFFLSAKSADTVKIVCGQDVYYYPLSEDKSITLENNDITLTVIIENGEVYVADSGCRDKICVHTFAISTGGSIVCLPARVVITVVTEAYDYVAG